MLWKTHAFFGILVLFSYSVIFDAKITIPLIVLAGIASIFPDLDEMKSKLGRHAKVIGFIFDHRGFLHTLWFGIIISVLAYGLFGIAAGAVFFVTFIGHLFLDSLTKKGIMPLFPLKYHIRGGVKTGGIAEKVMEWVFLILILFLGNLVIF